MGDLSCLLLYLRQPCVQHSHLCVRFFSILLRAPQIKRQLRHLSLSGLPGGNEPCRTTLALCHGLQVLADSIHLNCAMVEKNEYRNDCTLARTCPLWSICSARCMCHAYALLQ